MKQIQKESVKNMQEYRYPPCNLEKVKQVGKGGNGNGIVIDLPKSCKPKLVIKYFSVDSGLSNEKSSRRFSRFVGKSMFRGNWERKYQEFCQFMTPVFQINFHMKSWHGLQCLKQISFM